VYIDLLSSGAKRALLYPYPIHRKTKQLHSYSVVYPERLGVLFRPSGPFQGASAIALIMLSTLAALVLVALPLTSCSPAPIPAAAAAARDPMITPSPSEWSPTRTLKYKRGVVSDVEGDINSVLSALGSNIPSYVASGVPNFFQDFPTGDSVKSKLGLNDSQIAALPTQVLNLP